MEGAICLMLIALPLMVIGASQMKERVRPNPDDKITIRDSFRVLRSNKPLAYVLGSLLLQRLLQPGDRALHLLLHLQHG